MSWCRPLRPGVMSAVAHARLAPLPPLPARRQRGRTHHAQGVVEVIVVVRIQRGLWPMRHLPLLT